MFRSSRPPPLTPSRLYNSRFPKFGYHMVILCHAMVDAMIHETIPSTSNIAPMDTTPTTPLNVSVPVNEASGPFKSFHEPSEMVNVQASNSSTLSEDAFNFFSAPRQRQFADPLKRISLEDVDDSITDKGVPDKGFSDRGFRGKFDNTRRFLAENDEDIKPSLNPSLQPTSAFASLGGPILPKNYQVVDDTSNPSIDYAMKFATEHRNKNAIEHESRTSASSAKMVPGFLNRDDFRNAGSSGGMHPHEIAWNAWNRAGNSESWYGQLQHEEAQLRQLQKMERMKGPVSLLRKMEERNRDLVRMGGTVGGYNGEGDGERLPEQNEQRLHDRNKISGGIQRSYADMLSQFESLRKTTEDKPNVDTMDGGINRSAPMLLPTLIERVPTIMAHV